MSLTQITDLTVVYPRIKPHQLEINAGACKLMLFPSDEEFWVKGSYTSPQGTLIPKIEENGGAIKITQDTRIAGLRRLVNEIPVFDLHLGAGQPYELALKGGATQAYYELGGLPITSLNIQNGGGDFKYHFSTPNPQTMSMLRIGSGAGNLEFFNLANANFRQLLLEGGVGSYKLNLGGPLHQSATLKINTGVASVELLIPAGTAAKVATQTTLAQVNLSEGWTRQDGLIYTDEALAGSGPLLTVEAKLTVGSLSLKIV